MRRCVRAVAEPKRIAAQVLTTSPMKVRTLGLMRERASQRTMVSSRTPQARPKALVQLALILKGLLRGFVVWPASDAREIPFDFAQGRLSLRLKCGYARDDAARMGFRQFCFCEETFRRPPSPARFRRGWCLEVG